MNPGVRRLDPALAWLFCARREEKKDAEKMQTSKDPRSPLCRTLLHVTPSARSIFYIKSTSAARSRAKRTRIVRNNRDRSVARARYASAPPPWENLKKEEKNNLRVERENGRSAGRSRWRTIPGDRGRDSLSRRVRLQRNARTRRD